LVFAPAKIICGRDAFYRIPFIRYVAISNDRQIVPFGRSYVFQTPQIDEPRLGLRCAQRSLRVSVGLPGQGCKAYEVALEDIRAIEPFGHVPNPIVCAALQKPRCLACQSHGVGHVQGIIMAVAEEIVIASAEQLGVFAHEPAKAGMIGSCAILVEIKAGIGGTVCGSVLSSRKKETVVVASG
jgi:hypothetical protein